MKYINCFPVLFLFLNIAVCRAFGIGIIAFSRSISRGESAIVIYSAPESKGSPYILINKTKIIYPAPFLKKDFYIALLPWPLGAKSFDAAIISTNMSGVCQTAFIPFNIKETAYRTCRIDVIDSFLDKTGEPGQYGKNNHAGRLRQYNTVMEELQKRTVFDIRHETSSIATNMLFDNYIGAFLPIKNARVTSPFGEHRFIYLNNKVIGSSYHYGNDLAGTGTDSIFASNSGKIFFSGYNGLNGNMIVIDHGLGLYSVYCHLSTVFMKTGDFVPKGVSIAKSGHTGYAFGDHLHFGVIINGVGVNPDNWMDQGWINVNIIDVIAAAKKSMESL